MQIILTAEHRRILTRHAESGVPNESCAVLFGHVNGNDATISDIFLTENADRSPLRFTIPNEQLMLAYKTAEERDLDVVGIFHSHPDSEAYPSITDKKFMYMNQVAWVIYSGINQNFRAFMLDEDIFEMTVKWVNPA